MSTQEKDLVLGIFLGCIVHELNVFCELLPLRITLRTRELDIIVSIDETEVRRFLDVLLVDLM